MTETNTPPRPGRSPALCHKVAMAMARVDCIGQAPPFGDYTYVVKYEDATPVTEKVAA